ncbi:hypothetical protein pb186bvf_007888 [Paramecium bursaria]
MKISVDRKQWTASEDKILIKMINQVGTKWIDISKHLPNRNPSQCAQRWRRIKPKEKQTRVAWTQAEDDLVVELVDKLGKQWMEIQSSFPNRSSKTIRERYVNCLDPKINRSEFTKEEDDHIYYRFIEIGPKWAQISKEINSRSENQVKNRFHHKIRKDYLQIKHPYYQRTLSQAKKDQQSSIIKEEFATDMIDFSQYQYFNEDHEFSMCYFYSNPEL